MRYRVLFRQLEFPHNITTYESDGEVKCSYETLLGYGTKTETLHEDMFIRATLNDWNEQKTNTETVMNAAIATVTTSAERTVIRHELKHQLSQIENIYDPIDNIYPPNTETSLNEFNQQHNSRVKQLIHMVEDVNYIENVSYSFFLCREKLTAGFFLSQLVYYAKLLHYLVCRQMTEAIDAGKPFQYNVDLIVDHAERVLKQIESDFIEQLMQDCPEIDIRDRAILGRVKVLSLAAKEKIHFIELQIKKRNVAMFYVVDKEHGLAGFIHNAKVFMDVCLLLLWDLMPRLRIVLQVFEWQIQLLLLAVSDNRFRQFNDPADAAASILDWIHSAPFLVTAHSVQVELADCQQNWKKDFSAIFVTRRTVDVVDCSVESTQDAKRIDTGYIELDNLFHENLLHYRFIKECYGDIMEHYEEVLMESLLVGDGFVNLLIMNYMISYGSTLLCNEACQAFSIA